jgi:hypothetical protein
MPLDYLPLLLIIIFQKYTPNNLRVIIGQNKWIDFYHNNA